MKITVEHLKNGQEVEIILDIPVSIFDKCEFDPDIGSIIGHDYVDEYLRNVHGIYCIDWNLHHSEDIKNWEAFVKGKEPQI